MNFAKCIEVIVKESEVADKDCLVAQGYKNILEEIKDNAFTHNQIATNVQSDQVFREYFKRSLTDINDCFDAMEDIIPKLKSLGFEIVNYSKEEDDFDLTIQPE